MDITFGPETTLNGKTFTEISNDYALLDTMHGITMNGETTTELMEKLRETNPRVLAHRQKKINYGYNTVGYTNLVLLQLRADPPDIHQKCNKRSWYGQYKKWRRRLHQYDPKP